MNVKVQRPLYLLYVTKEQTKPDQHQNTLEAAYRQRSMNRKGNI